MQAQGNRGLLQRDIERRRPLQRRGERRIVVAERIRTFQVDIAGGDVNGAEAAGEMTEAVIAIDGDYYAVSERTLALLRSGMSPADLDLYPVDPEDDAPEPFDGDYCHADHFGANLKSKGAA